MTDSPIHYYGCAAGVVAVTSEFDQIMNNTGKKDVPWFVEMVAWHHKIKSRS